MKKLTLLSVCAFALSLSAAHAQDSLVDTNESPILGVTDPVDGNKSTVDERNMNTLDNVLDDDVDTTATIDEETEVNEAGNYGEPDTAPDEVDEDLAEQEGVIYEMDDEIETGTIADEDLNDDTNESAIIGVDDPVDGNKSTVDE